jgi:hypothetical protein
MNGDLLTTEILVGRAEGSEDTHGVFYSIIDPNEVAAESSLFTIEVEDNGALKLTATTGSGYTVTPTTIAAGEVERVKVTKDGKTVYDEVIKNY